MGIQSACNISLNQNLTTGIENCSTLMTEFRVKVNITKENFTTNCSSWAELKSYLPALRDCNRGKSTNGTTLKDKEAEVKDLLSNCKKALSGCKKYEDQSIAYISTCKTSSNSLKNVLYGLYQATEKVTKVKSKIASALNTTTKTTGRRRTREAEALSNCSSLTTSVALFVTYTSVNELDVIGTNTTIKYLATSISITDTSNHSCSQTEKTSLSSAETSLKSTLVQIELRKSQVYTMLQDLTSSTPSKADVAANVEILPVAAPNTTTSSTSMSTSAVSSTTATSIASSTKEATTTESTTETTPSIATTMKTTATTKTTVTTAGTTTTKAETTETSTTTTTTTTITATITTTATTATTTTTTKTTTITATTTTTTT